MMGRLRRDHLESLIAENDIIDWRLGNHLRSAAFAELARRAPEEALQLAESSAGQDDDVTRLKIDLFSVIRGWAEIDPAGAWERLRELEVTSEPTDDGTVLAQAVHTSWKHPATRHLFAQYARQDLEAALASLPGKEERDLREHAWIGLFTGANDPDTQADQGSYLWIPGATYGFGAPRLQHFEAGLGVYGIRHPKESLQALQDDFPDEMEMALARGIITAHPEYAKEVLATISAPEKRVSLLLKAIDGKGREREEQLYPLPGEFTSLPDYENHYHLLLGAARSAELPADGRQTVLDTLRNEFVGKVPEAGRLPAQESAN